MPHTSTTQQQHDTIIQQQQLWTACTRRCIHRKEIVKRQEAVQCILTQGLRWFCWVAGRLQALVTQRTAVAPSLANVEACVYQYCCCTLCIIPEGGSFWLLLLRCVISGFQTRNQMSCTTYTGGTHSRQTDRQTTDVYRLLPVPSSSSLSACFVDDHGHADKDQ